MSRELTSSQAFQTYCLGQMGVVSWFSQEAEVAGTVFMPVQPWGSTGSEPPSITAPVVNMTAPLDQSQGFAAATPPPVPMAPEEKEQSVAELREQLNSGPEIIVEDLQPIEELAVDIEVPEEELVSQITQLDIRVYVLSNKLLVLSDVPPIFSQEDEVEALVLKMAKALLKEPIENWQSSTFSWPGGLNNAHFITRTDWMFGALESFVTRLVKHFPEPPLLVLAGNQVSQFVEDLPVTSPLKNYSMARTASLPELHRIPELRKEAWEVMQSCLLS